MTLWFAACFSIALWFPDGPQNRTHDSGKLLENKQITLVPGEHLCRTAESISLPDFECWFALGEVFFYFSYCPLAKGSINLGFLVSGVCRNTKSPTT
jgi:hypothetical protein